MTLEVGRWYMDTARGHENIGLGHCFKLLGVAPETVDVIDSDGERRVVNRLMFEAQMQLL